MKKEQDSTVEAVETTSVTTTTANIKPQGRRTPIYKQRSTGIKSKAGFVRRQVVEKPGRVEMFLEAGWRPVTEDGQDLRDSRLQHDSQLGTVMRQVVNRKPGAEAQTAIWMEIEEEYYKADQLAKQRLYDEKMASVNPKNMQKSNPDVYYTGSLEIQ